MPSLPPESSFIVSIGADAGACVVGAGVGADVGACMVVGADVGACVVGAEVGASVGADVGAESPLFVAFTLQHFEDPWRWPFAAQC